MDTDIDIAESILANGIHRADGNAFAALNAKIGLYKNPAAGAVSKGSGGTDRGTGCRVTGQAPAGNKAGGKTARGMNSNPGGLP